MARKIRLRHHRPGEMWRETNRAKQRTQAPANSLHFVRSKEAQQTENTPLRTQAKSRETDAGPQKQ